MGYYKVECPNCDNIYKLHEDFNCINCGKNGILKMDSATSATPDDNTYGCGKCRVQWEWICLLYTSPSPRDAHESRMPSSA